MKEQLVLDYKDFNKKAIDNIHTIVSSKGLTYKINTYGCQMNEHDSEKIAGLLETMGYVLTKDDSADLTVFNTCCVRDNAENKLFGNVGALKEEKLKNKKKLIAVCGCMMQQKDVAAELKAKFPFIDIIFGTHNIQNLPELILSALNNKKSMEILEVDGYIIEDMPTRRTSSFSACVTIMYGCNNFCSYCIVPYVRGRERSRDSKNIIAEVQELCASGISEITLLGQNVNSYGLDNKEDLSFAGLLIELNKTPGLKRLKFMTSHPKDISDELIEAIKTCDKVCNYLHLPIQAGSNRVLSLMNRGYTKENYKITIDKIRKSVPNIGITTDIICGFPGETDEDFQETLDLVKEVGFDGVFCFNYNIRKGTKAATMDGQIPEKEKSARLAKLIRLQKDIAKEAFSKLIGNTYEVLIDKTAKRDGQVSARTTCGKLINMKGDNSLIGQYVNVKITQAHENSLVAEIID